MRDERRGVECSELEVGYRDAEGLQLGGEDGGEG